MIDPVTHRPALATGVRLHRDSVRERDVLLFPEGALVLNDTAAAVLALCDGTRTVVDIATELATAYGADDLLDDVVELLEGVAEQGLLEPADG